MTEYFGDPHFHAIDLTLEKRMRPYLFWTMTTGHYGRTILGSFFDTSLTAHQQLLLSQFAPSFLH